MKPEPDIRPYRPGEESILADIFNGYYSGLWGVNRKTAESWKQAFTENEDIEKGEILVIEEEGIIQGFIALGKSGRIYDFCVKSDQENPAFLYKAINKLSTTASERGFNQLSLAFPPRKRALQKALIKSGFHRISPPDTRMECLVINHRKLIETILEKKKILPRFFSNILLEVKVVFKYQKKPFIILPVRFQKGIWQTSPDPDFKPGIKIALNSLTLSEICLGKITPLKGWMMKRLIISPPSKLLSALYFLYLLRTKGRWYIPFIDWR